LEKSKIGVFHFGRSFRPATDGIQYDHFIRLSKPSSKYVPTQSEIEKALYTFSEIITPTKISVGHLNQSISQSINEVEKMVDEILSRKKRISELEEEIDKMKFREKLLKVKYLSLSNELMKSLNDKADQVHLNEIELRKNIESELLELFSNEIEQEKDHVLKLQNENYRLQFDLKSISENYNSLKDQSSVTIPTIKKVKHGFDLAEDAIKALLPTVTFLRGTLKLVYSELNNSSKFLSQIYHLTRDGYIKSEKLVESANDWRESHIERSYRLYYRKHNLHEFEIYLSFKTDQKEDINWLKTL
jgi:chromosome segregation ATPase